MLAACGRAPTPQVTAEAVQPSPSNTFIRPTLPPTWTATFTPTPAPPTATPTVTPTPSATPTSSPQDICKTFFFVSNLTGLSSSSTLLFLKQDAQITMVGGTNSTDDKVHFEAVNRISQKQDGADLPGGGMLGVNFPVKSLPGTGQYDWTVVVQDPNYGDLCKQGGTFVVVSRESTRPEERSVR